MILKPATDPRWTVIAILVNIVALIGASALLWALVTGRVHQ